MSKIKILGDSSQFPFLGGFDVRGADLRVRDGADGGSGKQGKGEKGWRLGEYGEGNAEGRRDSQRAFAISIFFLFLSLYRPASQVPSFQIVKRKEPSKIGTGIGHNEFSLTNIVQILQRYSAGIC